MLYCKNRYSYRSLENQFATLLMELVEKRLGSQGQYTSQISEAIFYAQTVLTRMEDVIDECVDILFAEMTQESSRADTKKQLILGVACGWFGVCLVVGLAVLLRMRLRYFKEIYMITFLNQEMVLGNKRVESFLVTITKNSK